MAEISEFMELYQETLVSPALPGRLSACYLLESALGHRAGSSVFLIRRKTDSAPFVLKINTDGRQDLSEEFCLLGQLPKGLAPKPVEYFEENGVQYLVRAYLDGQTLAEAWEEGVDFDRWADLGMQLCGLLSEIHSLKPPVVHRDIKPENIILSPEGRPYLIDFGIARSYKPEQGTDTVHMGTRTTAAPEQYGFAQSDQRTDLYALGVTLRWMATGSYRSESLKDAACPRWMKRFLRRAAAFDPADRFPSADAMLSVLRRHTGSRQRRRRILPILAACLALLAGLLLWNAGQRTVDFGSSLLETAVRAELNKPEGVITKKELKEVRRLAVVGQRLLGKEQSFRCRLCLYIDGEAQIDVPRGDISDLSVLAEMPNLTSLCLCSQEIRDLSPLAGLPLREVYLYDNQISDLTPLEQMMDVGTLCIGSNPFGDLSPLALMENLRELNLDCWDWYEPETLEPLAGTRLEYLSAGNLCPKDGDWSFLRTLEDLHTLWLWNPPWTAAEELEGCGVRELNLGNYQLPDLTALPALPELEFLGIFNTSSPIEGIQKQAGLRRVSLCNQEGVDLAPAAALSALEELYIYNVTTNGFASLSEASAMRRVVVDTEAVRAAVENDCPGHRFEIALS